MTALFLVIGAIIGGGVGWALGRFNSRRTCDSPTWGLTRNPWSGAIVGAIFGFIIGGLIGAV